MPIEPTSLELHGSHSLSCVRKGSFGCRADGEARDLVAGSMLAIPPIGSRRFARTPPTPVNQTSVAGY
jgi:hypothetical protein